MSTTTTTESLITELVDNKNKVLKKRNAVEEEKIYSINLSWIFCTAVLKLN